MHYRGGSKRHVHRVRLSQVLAPGSLLEVDGRTPIQLLDVVEVVAAAEALAVVHDDANADPRSGREARVGDEAVFVQILA